MSLGFSPLSGGPLSALLSSGEALPPSEVTSSAAFSLSLSLAVVGTASAPPAVSAVVAVTLSLTVTTEGGQAIDIFASTAVVLSPVVTATGGRGVSASTAVALALAPLAHVGRGSVATTSVALAIKPYASVRHGVSLSTLLDSLLVVRADGLASGLVAASATYIVPLQVTARAECPPPPALNDELFILRVPEHLSVWAP